MFVMKCTVLFNLSLLMLTACAPAGTGIEPTAAINTVLAPVTQPAETAPVPAATPTSVEQVSITGWFTTVWNGEPHYSITDGQGVITELLLDPEVAKPLGGPLELDRKRVTIVGEVTSHAPKTVRVVSVQFAGDE